MLIDECINIGGVQINAPENAIVGIDNGVVVEPGERVLPAVVGFDDGAGGIVDEIAQEDAAVASVAERNGPHARDGNRIPAGVFQCAQVVAGFAVIGVDAAIAEVGVDRACDLFFAAEREYWQRKNRAAQAQKARQDCLGLGWANHDHHTYRASRRYFAPLIRIWEKLGFVLRERFYAGREAGWGAQISEQALVGIEVFADAGLMAAETQIDFSSQKLPPAPRLGTVGLWIGLHGESFLEAGMHHLEARFDRVDILVDSVRIDLARRELALLEFLVMHVNQVLRRADILGHVWRSENDGRSRTIDAHVRRLRMKLGAAGKQIETVSGIGYRFREDRV